MTPFIHVGRLFGVASDLRVGMEAFLVYWALVLLLFRGGEVFGVYGRFRDRRDERVNHRLLGILFA